MLLSILIPTYNLSCYKLVYDLQQQLISSGVEYEIIVADDGSRDQVSVIANLKINELDGCRYLRRTENVGRAAIRNVLAREAKGEWLIFIDNDAKVERPDYIARYIATALENKGNAMVFPGGLYHADSCPSPLVTLRYRYEKEADCHRRADERNLDPYSRFTTFNVMIHRDVMKHVMFDEQCHEYGHEDTLFGQQLKAAGIKVMHIDNPLQHVGLESNEIFLKKTVTAIKSLIAIKGKLEGMSQLEVTAEKICRWHIAWFVRILFHLAKPIMMKNLRGTNPSLFVFKIFKLGTYLDLLKA
ncbi:MAG: glycosyltransferase family 2 protein [Bacteroidales bacterium]|nr:glycosyltransferase family 2 protein [Candidatus Liminaster caballi]